jgi:hypothetical protein
MENTNAMSKFPLSSRWNIPTSNLLIVPNLVNGFSFHVPINDPKHLSTVPKHDFDEEWDCPAFKGRSKTKGVRMKGETWIDSIRDLRLGSSSHSGDWVNVFVPPYGKAQGSKSKSNYTKSNDKLYKWSNKKDMLM